MSYSDARTNAALDALLSGATKLRIFTASYAAQLAEVAFTLGSSSVASAVATLPINDTLPIADTWEATGTAAAFRVLNSSNVVIFEGTGSWAVGGAGGGALLQLSSVSAVSGTPLNITGVSFTLPTKVTGEP